MKDAPTVRLRFSLFNFMIVVAIAALAVALFASAQRNARLHADNDRLAAENLKHRNELGIFDVTDDTQVHVIRVPTAAGEPRRYRIYLPPGMMHTIRYAVNGIPQSGVPPTHDGGSELAPGHYVVSVKLTRASDRVTGEPMPHGNVLLDVTTTQGTPHRSRSFGIGISESKNDWLVNKETGNTAYSWQEIGRTLEVFGAAETVVLYRARAFTPVVRARGSDGKPTSWSSKPIAGECDGFMVWIESSEVEAE